MNNKMELLEFEESLREKGYNIDSSEFLDLLEGEEYIKFRDGTGVVDVNGIGIIDIEYKGKSMTVMLHEEAQRKIEECLKKEGYDKPHDYVEDEIEDSRKKIKSTTVLPYTIPISDNPSVKWGTLIKEKEKTSVDVINEVIENMVKYTKEEQYRVEQRIMISREIRELIVLKESLIK